jgi:hypothetical protein
MSQFNFVEFMSQHYQTDINDIIDGSDEFDRDQQKLFDMFEAKFPISIDFHDDMEKTISGYPKDWTNITTNNCRPDDRSVVILTGKVNNLTVIDIDVIKPKDGNKYDNYKKDEYGLGLFLKIMEVSSLEALASCTACHIIKSTSGGYHIYTKYLENLPSGNNVLPKIDIKNDKAGIIFTSKHEVISLSRDPSGGIDDYIAKEVQKAIPASKAYKHYEKNKQFIKISLDHVKNMLDALDKDRANNYDDWLNIGIILNNEFGDEAFELFNNFSKSSKKYKSETEIRKFWYGLKQRTEGNRLSIGSLFHYVKSDSPSKYKKLSDEYFDSIKIDFSMEIPENKKAYYMDYKTRKEWVFNQDLLIYLKQRIYYYEKIENVWYVRDYDSVADQYSYLQIQDSKLYNTNIYVETVTGRMKLKTLIDLCLKLYLTVDEVNSIPYNNLYPSPKNILNLYIDNNDKYYDPSLEIDNNLIEPFLYHLREILASANKEAYDYLLNWTAHKVQKPHKKIKTAMVLMSAEQGTGKSLYTDILKSLTGDNLVSTNIDKLMESFNSCHTRKTVIVLEELKKGLSNDTCDFLKNFVTMDKIAENEKHKASINIHHYGDLIICSNNEHTLKLSETDRRYFITEVNCKKMKDLQYFAKLAEYKDYSSDKFKHLYNYLMRLDITKFLPQQIPVTDFKKDLIEEQKSPVIQFVEYTNTQYLITDKSFEATDTPDMDKVDKISAINLYQRYTAFCKENGITFILSSKSFGGNIKRYYKCTRNTKGITYSVRYIQDGIKLPETPEE